MSYSVLRLPEVIAKTGLSRSTIYDKLNSNSERYDASFPTPISLGERAVGFVNSEIDTWIESRINHSRSNMAA